ncbi:MAG: acyltransferase, partial [Pedobacter sp.]
MPARIKIIDASRGIAAIIVLVHHFMTFYGGHIKSVSSLFVFNILSFISDLNTEAVLFFFIISGFCIGLAQKGILPLSKEEILSYTEKRLLRILPIYFLALFVTFLAGIVTNAIYYDTSYGIINFLGNLFFLQTPEGVKHWFSPYGHNGPLW